MHGEFTGFSTRGGKAKAPKSKAMGLAVGRAFHVFGPGMRSARGVTDKLLRRGEMRISVATSNPHGNQKVCYTLFDSEFA